MKPDKPVDAPTTLHAYIHTQGMKSPDWLLYNCSLHQVDTYLLLPN